MLENSIWTQFHTEKTIRETLAEVLSIDAVQISSDESELYAMIKRHLTKKELKLFIIKFLKLINGLVMVSAIISY